MKKCQFHNEVERKFLVDPVLFQQYIDENKPKLIEKISQGYFCKASNHNVRIRVVEQFKREKLIQKFGLLTIKGKAKGISRPEFNVELPYDESLKLFNLCDNYLDKIRYFIKNKQDKKIWHIDSFVDYDNLIIAEIELDNENEEFATFNFLLQEVTKDKKYSNSNLTLVRDIFVM